MGLIRLCARMLMAVALAATAVAAAPSGAMAHAGHRHHHTSDHETSAVHRQASAIERHAHVTHGDDYSAQVRSEVVAAADASGTVSVTLRGIDGSGKELPAHPQGCPGCCCCVGAGCGTAWLVPLIALTAPGAIALLPKLREGGGAGVTPDALPEPPRALV